MKTTTLKMPVRWHAAGLLLASMLGGGAAWSQTPAITAITPAPNLRNANPASAVAVTFDRPLSAASTAGLKVFSAQRGGLRHNSGGTLSVNGSVLTFAAPTAFLPGETVRASVTRAVQSTGGQALAGPRVVQYTTAAGGTGKGVFGLPPIAVLGSVPVGDGPLLVNLADVDGDGDLDLLTCNDNANTVSIRVNNGTGVFTLPVAPVSGTVGVGTNPRCLTTGDVDGDGDIDLLVGNETNQNVSLRLNAQGNFYDPGASGTIATGGTPRGLALGDIDGDGDLDLLIANESASTVSVRFNSGTGVFSPPVLAANDLVAVGASCRGLVLADVDGDGDLDFLVANVGAGTVSLRLNDGTGVFAAPAVAATGTIATGIGCDAVAVGDLDGDGDLDFVASNYQGGTVSVRLNTGGAFAPPAGPALAEVAIGGLPFDVALGDVDADGDLDFVTSTANSNAVSVRLNNGSGAFASPAVLAYAEVAMGDGTYGIALGDADADGDLDFVTANLFSDNAGVRLNGPGPEINVRLDGGGPSYLTGSTYNFGTVPVNASTPVGTFRVKNLSTTNALTLSNFVFIANAGATGNFAATATPRVLAPGDSAFFTISLRPTATGLQTASVTIANDDPDESVYVVNFQVTGGAAPTAVTWTGAVDTRWDLAGNWSPAVVPTATTAVTILPAPNQPVVTTATATCADIQVENEAVVTVVAGGYLTVLGNLSLLDLAATPDGRFEMSGGTLELKGNLPTTGGFNATGGLVTLTGTTEQLLGRTGTMRLWNLTVGPAGARMANRLELRRILTLRGDFETQNFGLFLRSDATATAMVVNAGGRVTNRAIIERYIGGTNPGLGYRHFSSPVLGAPVNYLTPLNAATRPVVNPAYNTVGNTVTPFPTAFRFDEARLGAAGVPGPVGFDQGWVSPTALSETMTAGRGYTMNLTATNPGTELGDQVAFIGAFNTGSIAVAGGLSRSGTGAFAGYHLLGNPYPSPIDWDNVVKPAGLDDAAYVFRSTGQYAGFYDSYVNGLGTLAGGEIAAMQGFFVHVSQAVPAFGFTDAARLTTYANPAFQRPTAETRPVLALALRPAAASATAPADQAFIYFEAGATAGLDGHYDAAKLPNPGSVALASVSGAEAYAINGLPLLGAAPVVVPLAVSVPQAGAYELAAEELVNFAPGTTLWLRDALLGTVIPLAPTTRYAFTLAGVTAPGRFAVEFRPAGVLAAAGPALAAQVQLFPNPARANAAAVTVSLPALPGSTASATLLNALGQVVGTIQLPVRAGQATGQLPTAGLAAGVYVVRVQAGAAVITKRLVLE